MDPWKAGRYVILLSRLCSIIILVITIYSGAVILSDIYGVLPSITEGKVTSIPLKNRGFLPLTVDIKVTIGVKGNEVPIEKHYEVPPGVSTRIEIKPEDVMREALLSILEDVAYDKVQANVHVSVLAFLEPFITLTAEAERSTYVGPLITKQQVIVEGIEPVNLTHVKAKLRVSIVAPLLADTQWKYRLWVNDNPTEWSELKANERGEVDFVEEVILSVDTRSVKVEVCIENLCKVINVGV
ncbi:MAG: hypothetical protein DRO65_01115 [Candidatus Altiarchaeales archaeon]|nr:MAG: hypothetical protein DRO65_01115 [Candidatus Altiarchaeales archaeon]